MRRPLPAPSHAPGSLAFGVADGRWAWPEHGKGPRGPGPWPLSQAGSANSPLPELAARTGEAAETLPKKELGCGGPGYF